MLNLTKNKIQDDKITNIYLRKAYLWIQIVLLDTDNINLFYDTEEEYEKDREICKNWLENRKMIVENNRKEIENQNLILNSLDTLKQVCEYYCDDCEKCPLRIEDIDLMYDAGSLCFFEGGFPPSTWELVEPDTIEIEEPYVQLNKWAY